MCVCFFFFLFGESKFFSMRFPPLIWNSARFFRCATSLPTTFVTLSLWFTQCAHALRQIKLMIHLICWRVAIGMWPPNMALFFPLQSLTAPPKIHVESDVIRCTENFLRRLVLVESPGAPPLFVAVEIQTWLMSVSLWCECGLRLLFSRTWSSLAADVSVPTSSLHMSSGEAQLSWRYPWPPPAICLFWFSSLRLYLKSPFCKATSGVRCALKLIGTFFFLLDYTWNRPFAK